MPKPLSLKKQIEQANIGESFLTDQARTGAYVAAKRARSTITTEEVGTQIRVTVTGRQFGPKLSLVERVVADLSDLSVSERLEVFEKFELCCGMNRGECVCPPEPITASRAEAYVDRTEDERQEAIDRLRGAVAEIELPWIEDPVTYEDSEILYWHHKPKCKPVCYRRESDLSGGA